MFEIPYQSNVILLCLTGYRRQKLFITTNIGEETNSMTSSNNHAGIAPLEVSHHPKMID
jgi:hypothetical protein